MYSLGYLLYLMLGLKFAFQNLPRDQLRQVAMNFHKILPKSKMVRSFPESLTSLVVSMLHKNPDGRPTWGNSG